MLNIQIILITIIFLILIVVSYIIKVSKAGYPLTFLYISFLVYFFTNQIEQNMEVNKIFTNEKISDNKTNSENYLKPSEKFNHQNKNSKPVPINLSDKLLKPKPLIFKPNTNDKNYKLETFSKNNEEKEGEQEVVDILILKEIKICRAIKDRNPIQIAKSFNSSVDSLFCYTKIQNKGEKREIRHVWYYKNEIKTQIKYNIRRSNVYRSWTLKNINPNDIGEWKVEIQDSNGKILGSTKFYIQNT
ncbi:MAG: DUF2914 domain-containing protein [Candidatus Neomarinimicrobiota bacterium]